MQASIKQESGRAAMAITLSEIHVFPVKGCAGVSLATAEIEPWGLRGDRRWLVIDGAGRFISQRAQPCMALLAAEPINRGIRLSLPGHDSIEVDEPGPQAQCAEVTVWRDGLAARLANAAAHGWISAALGQPCRLVHMHDTASRQVNPLYSRPGETVSFADAFPILLTSEASLADLNGRLGEPVPIGRFRGNLVVGGAAPWAEDTWRRLRIGGTVFRVAAPCTRCIVTTIDQQSGTRPDPGEPLRTLGTFRRDARGIMFGQNLIAEAPGRVAQGDLIEILEIGPPNVQPVSGN